MNQYVTFDRPSDACWTLMRFVCCLGPAIVVSLLLLSSFPNPRDYRAQIGDATLDTDAMEILQIRENLFLLPVTGGMAVFSWLQLSARSPFRNPQMLHWLGIHGWDGSEKQLPYGQFVPVTEILCITAVTIFCGLYSHAGFVLLPWAWLVCRAVLQSPDHTRQILSESENTVTATDDDSGSPVEVRRMAQRLPLTPQQSVAILWILLGTSVILVRCYWLSAPIIGLAIVLHHLLTMNSLVQLADELMVIPLPASGPEGRSFLDAIKKNRETASLFPFYPLRPEVADTRPDWAKAILRAGIATFFVVCLISAIPVLLPIHVSGRPREPFPDGVVCFMMLTASAIVRCFRLIESTWLPRLWPLSRILTGRPIVASYDRVLVPLLIAGVIGMAIIAIPHEWWRWSLTVSVFASSLLVQRGTVSLDEWQMTADARLSTALCSNQQPMRR